MAIPGFPDGFREVVREEKVKEWLRKHSTNDSRLNEAFLALEWNLVHKPDDGMCIEGGRMAYVQYEDSVAQTPSLWAVYTFDDRTVRIISVKQVGV